MTSNQPRRIKKKPKQILLAVLVLVGVYVFEKFDVGRYLPTSTSASALQQAIANKQSDTQVQSSGTIIKVLPDDNKGSRHQRFLVRLDNGHVILIAHNIDLAPRVDNPQKGEIIEFHGEFEWNDKGGVVHWTHHDPRGKHISGWLKYHGKKYE